MTASHRTEQWITHLVCIGRSDDPCKVASEAAGLMRDLLHERGELLVALKAARDHLTTPFIDTDGVVRQYAKAIVTIQDAIAKAEGF